MRLIEGKAAGRVGVQLVYTTGVYDLNALSKFPCVVRLRNVDSVFDAYRVVPGG